MSSFCLGCGTSLLEGQRFCGNCGRDSSLSADAPRPDPAASFGFPPETSPKAIFQPGVRCAVSFFHPRRSSRRGPGAFVAFRYPKKRGEADWEGLGHHRPCARLCGSRAWSGVDRADRHQHSKVDASASKCECIRCDKKHGCGDDTEFKYGGDRVCAGAPGDGIYVLASRLKEGMGSE